MVTIFTALRQEADGLIQTLELHRDNDNTYSGNGIRLIITGIGKINAAASVGFCIGKYGVSDYYVNYGSAASQAHTGETLFVGQIIDRGSGDESFPDIADAAFPHALLVTSDTPVSSYEILRDSSERRSAMPVIYDMEGYAIYQALRKVTTPDRMIFIKTATDNGEADFKKSIELINEAAPQVAGFIRSLSEQKFSRPEELPFFEELSSGLHCSEAMRNHLSQYIKYISVSDRLPEFAQHLDELKRDGQLPAPDRKHGKELLKKMLSAT